MRKTLLSLVLLLLLAAPANAAILSTDQLRGEESLLPYLSWLADPQAGYSIDTITSAASSGAFLPLSEGIPLTQEGPVWLRLVLISNPALTPQGQTDRFVMNVGALPPGNSVLYVSEHGGPVAGITGWMRGTLLPHSFVDLPRPGLAPVSIYLYLEEPPGPWFAPSLMPKSQVRPDLLPLDLILPGIFLLGMFMCLVRLFAHRSVWALWAFLFLGCILVQGLIPLPAFSKGLALSDLPALLAPGLALILLSQTGRNLLTPPPLSGLASSLLTLYAVAGAVLCLLPLVPGMGWLTRLFPLWPLLLFPLLPFCLGFLSNGRRGSLAFAAVCFLGFIGACLALVAAMVPDMHPMAGNAALWGFALGALVLIFVRGGSQPVQSATETAPPISYQAMTGGGNEALDRAFSSLPEREDFPPKGQYEQLPELQVVNGGQRSEAAEREFVDEPVPPVDLSGSNKTSQSFFDSLTETSYETPQTAAAKAVIPGSPSPLNPEFSGNTPPVAAGTPAPEASYEPVRPDSEMVVPNLPDNPEDREASGYEDLQYPSWDSQPDPETRPEPAPAASPVDSSGYSSPKVFTISGDHLEPVADGYETSFKNADGTEPVQASGGATKNEPGSQAEAAPRPDAPEGGLEPDGMAAGTQQNVSATGLSGPDGFQPAGDSTAFGPSLSDPVNPVPSAARQPALLSPTDGTGRSPGLPQADSAARQEPAVEQGPPSLPPEPRIISLVDDTDFSWYSMDLMEELQEGEPRRGSLPVESSFVFNLNSLVRDVHESIAPLAKHRGLVYSWYVDPNLPSLLEGDAPRLRQALTLLLQNAVQATGIGMVQLVVRKDPNSPASPNACRLVFTILDSGASQRTDAGFFHAWELASRTDGNFSVSYSPNQGTQIHFSVGFILPAEDMIQEHLRKLSQQPESTDPAHPAPADSLQAAYLQGTLSSRGLEERAVAEGIQVLPPEAGTSPAVREWHDPSLMRIIVADTTTSNRRLLVNYLSGLAHEHVEAPSTLDVPALLKEKGASLVIFDADMPETEIIRAMGEIRNREHAHGLSPLPLVTLVSHEAQGGRMLEAGASRFLLKPFDRESLETLVRDLLKISAADLAAVKPATGPGQPETGSPSEDGSATVVTSGEAEEAPRVDVLAEALRDAPEAYAGKAIEVDLPPINAPAGPGVQAAPIVHGLSADDVTPPVPAGQPAAHSDKAVKAEKPNQADAGTAPQQGGGLLDLMIIGESDGEEARTASPQRPKEQHGDKSAKKVRIKMSTPEPDGPSEEAVEAPQAILESQDSPLGAVQAEGVPSPNDPALSAAPSTTENPAVQANPETPADQPERVTAAQPTADGTSPDQGFDSISPNEAGDFAPAVTPEEPEPAAEPGIAAADEPDQQTFPLPGMDGEVIESVMLPLLPGVMYALRDALDDAEKGRENGQTLLIQEAASRLAGKAEVFNLHRLSKIGRCVERAAEADDLEAAGTLMEDLTTVTRRYLDSLQQCYQSFLDLER